MKLCYVLNQFPELSQTFVLGQIVDLVQRGHEVDIIAARTGNDATHHGAFGRADLRDHLAARTRYTGMPEGMLARMLWGLLLTIPATVRHPKAFTTGWNIRRFGWFAATGSLVTMGLPLMNEYRRYDAVIAHFGPQGMVAQALREMGVLTGPLVTFFHAYDLTSAPRLAGDRMYGRLFERGELHLAISERGARQLIALGAPPKRVRLHHMGVDCETFHPHRERNATRSNRVRQVVSIGRLVPKKGFEHGLRAVAKARARGARLEYSIYGTGPMALQLQRAIDEFGLRGWARLCGPASQEALAETLRSADVLLTPSITSRNGDEEGIPMVLMEAMATELPVVATNSGGVSELVQHQQCGLLTREADSDAMSEALIQVSGSGELAQRLGSAGRVRVLADFNQAEQGRKLVELLARLGGEG